MHPAEIAIDGDVQAGLRVFITSHRLIAWGTEDRTPVKVLDVELAEPFSVPADRSTLKRGQLECRLTDGTTAWVNRGRGCGCGSPLKALRAPVSWTGKELVK